MDTLGLQSQSPALAEQQKAPANNSTTPHSLVQEAREIGRERDLLARYYCMAPFAANS